VMRHITSNGKIQASDDKIKMKLDAAFEFITKIGGQLLPVSMITDIGWFRDSF